MEVDPAEAAEKKPKGNAIVELYNSKADLAEQTNLISRHAEVAERLKKQLLSFQDRNKQ